MHRRTLSGKGKIVKITLRNTGSVLIVALLLAACASTPPATVNHPAPLPAPVAPTPVIPAPTPPTTQTVPAVDTAASERVLAAGIGAYDRGDFGGAIKLLTPLSTDGSLDPGQQLRALKTLAFSQCSTGATTACRQTFERAFRADGNFDLAVAERGHPIWGPQFERARRAVLGR